MTAPRYLFVAGDASGDAHAALAARRLKALGAEIVALGGPSLRSVADEWLGDLVAEGVMGFWEPVKKLPVYWRMLKQVVEPAVRDGRVDVVVPTDFYGFNRHVAQAARMAGRRVCYFVSPQVWASRPGRVDVLKQCVDRMLVLFPFEERIYREAGIPVTFVGHPLVDEVPEGPPPAAHVEPVVGLLPGSRASEVRRLLPVFLEAADRMAAGTRFVLFAAPNLANTFYDGFMGSSRNMRHVVEMVRDERYSWRRRLDMALACSGTATLENALLGVPTVVAYKTSALTYLVARALVTVNNIAMPNVLAGTVLMPEYIQSKATAPALAKALTDLWADRPGRERDRSRMMALRAALGGGGFAERAAQALWREAP